MPRLGSKKSRNGCQNCKKRRVKCDERQPCGDCVRHGLECSLLTTSRPAVGPPSHSNSHDPLRGQLDPTPIQPVLIADYPSTSSSSGLADDAPRDCFTWMDDLQLMHHWTGYAHLTLPGTEHAKRVWGFCVPNEAIRFPFLMHCILAFSAYHLAHTNVSSRQRYRILASTHQTEALSAMNGVLSSIDSRNCHAVFAAASLLTLNAFAGCDEANVNNLIDIFQLLRGMDTVLLSTESIVHTGPFALILQQNASPSTPPPFFASMIIELQHTITTNEGQENIYGVAAAAEHLKSALQFGWEFSVHPALRATMLWPIKLDTHFVEEMKEKDNSAVQRLLDYYITVLEYAASEWWFLSGWRQVIR